MFNVFVLFLSLLEVPTAQPAYFQFDVDARTPYFITFDGDPISSNTRYKTEPLTETICVELEVRYIDGGEVVSRKMFVDLKPGKTCHLKIVISAKPEYVNC